MKKKKVLFLLEAFDKGGIEQVTLDIVNNLDPEKYDITVQTFWYGGHCQSLVNPNIKVVPFFFKRYVRGIIRLIDYLSPKVLYKLFVRGKYDVEIAASDGGVAKVISGSTNKKSKKICWVHMDVMNRGSELKEFKNEQTAYPIYSKFDVIVPVSESCKEKFITKFGHSYKYCVKKNPLPVQQIIQKSLEIMPFQYGEGLNFVCVGRLEDQKGFDRLMESCAELKSSVQQRFQVYIIGEGSKRSQLEELITKYKLTDTVFLLGFQSNPYTYIKNADAFLLTSRDEAFPLVVGESLIVGTPVIATDCCGISEWLDNGRYGMILENSTEGISQGVKKVLYNPELLDEFRTKISEAQHKISFEKTLSEFEELLNE